MSCAFRHILPFVLAFAFLASCTSDGEGPEGPSELSITPRSTDLEAAAGSVWVSVEASGSWTISLVYESDGGWASVEPSSGTGHAGNVRLRYTDNTGNGPRSVTMVLESNGSRAQATVTQVGLSGSTSDSFSNGTDVAGYAWLELPATEAGDGLTFFVHDMEGGKYMGEAKSGTRNWSFYWSAAEHMSLWVAYPLNNKLKGSGTSRSNAWGFDPLLPADAQPDVMQGSYGGGWTRGHQLPSADRLATFKANASTFYGTNMTPQDYDFNCGIWASLEGKVRSYASLSDTLYVVTGCQFKESTMYTGMNTGFRVKVPTHYFKALLFRGHSPYAIDGFMAAGYFFPHDSAIGGGNFLNYIMSIDELEAQTGIDFFPNLEAVVGKAKYDAIESQEPSNWWK